MKYDFSGYATKNDLRCSDGRVIRKDAFKVQHNQKVPLVWQHDHKDPLNVLGHAVLENRADGVYAYGTFNDTEQGNNARDLVKHGDITSLSIYANGLVQKGSDVVHGTIREVSLVLSGANPGALIDNINLVHDADGMDTEGVIYTNETITLPVKEEPVSKDRLQHAEDDKTQSSSADKSRTPSDEKTIQDVLDEMTDEQRDVVAYLVGKALEDDDPDELKQSDTKGGLMHANVFEGGSKPSPNDRIHLDPELVRDIVHDGMRSGSLKESVLSHAQEYGIENIDLLFPDAKSIASEPDFIKRRTEWVDKVLNGTRHTPFSRIKSLQADITEKEARAKGYIKGNKKKEEVFKLLKRVTTPQTIYKKQKLDRDDILDITDLDVVSFIKKEMRIMLDEEIARAILVGDGREVLDTDKIDEEHIRPIWKDDDLYAQHTVVDTSDPANLVESTIRAMSRFEGSGTPIMFTSRSTLTDMLLIKDGMNRYIYETPAALAARLGVSEVVPVDVFEEAGQRDEDSDSSKRNLVAVIVNLQDYTIGADKGGEVQMFDDFDIDFNQYKYLLEGRCSGCLTKPKSAIVLETKA